MATNNKLPLNKTSSILDNMKLRNRGDTIESQTEDEIDQPSAVKPSDEAEDKTTTAAIEDIVINESNEVLEAEDRSDARRTSLKSKNKRRFSLKKIFKNKWTYIILPILIIIALFAVPLTRYDLLGLVLSHNYQFSVSDSATNSPVGGATIVVAGHSLTTNSKGEASISLKLGKHKYSISKDLYRTTKGQILVGLLKPKTDQIKFVATGRQITIKITNKLNGKPVSGASVSILSTSSSTNASGQTSLVLPTKSDAYLATITANGFNNATTSITLTKNLNTFSLVPTGSIYFLASNSGLINVIKSNLDGGDPQVYVAASGHETPSTTQLIPSPDLKYLLLYANRNGSQPELYVVDNSTGNISEFDSAPDQFNLIGWSGDSFIYDEIDSSAATNTVGREQLKSYDAAHARLNILDQDQVNSGTGSYAYQTFSNISLISNEVIYIVNWSTSGSFDNSTLTTSIRGIQVSGVNKNDFQTFATPNTGTITVVKNSPSSLIFSVVSTSPSQTNYYQYSNGTVSLNTSLSSTNFTKSYPNYLISPSGTQTLWTNSGTYTGDQNGNNLKLLTIASGYSAYSWLDNVYILLSKNAQLYIAPADGSYQPTLVGNFLPSAS